MKSKILLIITCIFALQSCHVTKIKVRDIPNIDYSVSPEKTQWTHFGIMGARGTGYVDASSICGTDRIEFVEFKRSIGNVSAQTGLFIVSTALLLVAPVSVIVLWSPATIGVSCNHNTTISNR